MGFQHNPENINRAGRPPGGETARDLFLSVEVETESGDHWSKELIKKIILSALKGRETAQKIILDRMFGRPPQIEQIQLAETEGEPLIVEFWSVDTNGEKRKVSEIDTGIRKKNNRTGCPQNKDKEVNNGKLKE